MSVDLWPILGTFVYWVACLVVLAESLNKLERTHLLERGMSPGLRLVTALKVLAWLLLAIGAAGGIIEPLLRAGQPGVREVAIVVGFAVLIVRTRIKDEVLARQPSRDQSPQQGRP